LLLPESVVFKKWFQARCRSSTYRPSIPPPCSAWSPAL